MGGQLKPPEHNLTGSSARLLSSQGCAPASGRHAAATLNQASNGIDAEPTLVDVRESTLSYQLASVWDLAGWAGKAHQRIGANLMR
ncbi:hypothetical protein DSO57_1015061 [Entomophthora muscae]|uniref:Uncharacterized protein n=1 Tax=Entomophthora muscae TaxID=34485 RepID=A0ACC2SI09_9FUNG|nr:hypothetical protein DSO57_1015061 [Entomophthora muscae]